MSINCQSNRSHRLKPSRSRLEVRVLSLNRLLVRLRHPFLAVRIEAVNLGLRHDFSHDGECAQTCSVCLVLGRLDTSSDAETVSRPDECQPRIINATVRVL